MDRWALVIAFLTVSLWATAQTAAVPAYGGVSTSTGTAVIVAPPSQPLLVTPIVHLGTAAPGAGATNATLGNTAGAVNSTLANVPALPPIPILPEIATNPVPVVTVTEPAGAAGSQAATGLTISGTINPGVRFNTGVGSQSGAYPVGTMASNQVSLGEVAREWRTRMANQNARVFTNQDVQQLNQTGGVSVVGGVSGTAVSPGTPATGAVTQPGSAPSVAQPAGSVSQPATPGVAAPVPPQTNPSQPPPPMSQMQSGAASSTPAEMAQATPPPSPQETEAAPAPATRRPERQQLPRSSSLLPLMALVGVLATVAGLMAK